MSKFFVQLLLSVFLSVGALFGFQPHARTQISEALHGASAMIRETSDAAAGAFAHLLDKANASVSMSSEARAKFSKDSDTKADVKTKSNVDLQLGDDESFLDDLFSGVSLNDSTAASSQSNMDTRTAGSQLNQKNKTRSTLDLDIEPLK